MSNKNEEAIKLLKEVVEKHLIFDHNDEPMCFDCCRWSTHDHYDNCIIFKIEKYLENIKE